MRILMLGNSFTSANGMPQMLAELTGAEIVSHTRGGARLSEQLNPDTRMGARTQKALAEERWDYVILQEMSHGPVTSPEKFASAVKQLCGQIRKNGAVPVLFATWAYRKGEKKLEEKGWDCSEMARRLSDAYHQAARENDALIADACMTFYRLSPAQELYASDGIHPNEHGSRLAAETIAAVILKHKESEI